MSKKTKLTPQQRSLAKHLVDGKTITQAARLAGYADNGYVGQIGSQALEAIRNKMPEVLDAHGLTDDVLIEQYLKPLLAADRSEFAKHEGKITDELKCVSWGHRAQGLDMAFKLKGLYASKAEGVEGGSTITVNVLVMPDPSKSET